MHTHTHTHTQNRGRVRLVLGNSESLKIPADAAIVSDPPYGCRNDCDYSRFGYHRDRKRGKCYPRGVPGDDRPFDPSRWLDHSQVVLFGYQFFAARLPAGTILVWQKKSAAGLGKWLSDAELAWQKGGKGVYVFPHLWSGRARASEVGDHFHPTQKPVALMRWCLERLRLPKDSLIVDPYMGSGSTGVAAVQLGYRFLGCELVPEYYAIARRRIAAAGRL